MNFTLLFEYLLRLLPGLVLFAVLLIIVPKKQIVLRMILYIFLFLLIRDTMTPTGLWHFGTEGFFWIRFIDAPWLLVLFSISALFLVISMNYMDAELKALIVWFRGNKIRGIISGIAGAIVVVLPLFILYLYVPIDLRGGTVDSSLLLPIFLTTMLANFWEETLFRGYLQGYLESIVMMGPLKSALTSGVFFAFGHIFLAITVTDIGLPLLAFALYEGIIASLVRMKWGVIPATMTHGLAIFLLSSGLI